MNDGVKLTVGRPDINKAIIPSTQISDSTSAGRTLLTSSVQGQRQALSLFPTFNNYADLVANGPQQSSRVYITMDNWKTYAWISDLNQYVEISEAITSSGVAVSSGVNGNFSNLEGLAKNAAPEWWDGVPVGWSGVNTTFTIYSGLGTNNYVANLAQLSTGPSGNSFRQNLGYLPISSDVELTFTLLNSFPAFGTPSINAAIYDGNYNNLATGSYTTIDSGTFTLTGNSISAGTNVIIGFWAAAANPALDNVSVSQTTPSTTWILPTNLPTTKIGLPSGALYNQLDGAGDWVLKIKKN